MPKRSLVLLFAAAALLLLSAPAQAQTTVNRAILTLVNPQINQLTQITVRFIHLSFDWTAGDVVTYAYPSQTHGTLANFKREPGTSFICEGSTDGTTFTTLSGCTESAPSIGFSFTVPASFMSGSNPIDAYVRFGTIRVPSVVQNDYPGPTITLASSGGVAKGTYLGTETMPSPEPIPLTATFIASNSKPGTLSDYTFTITTTADISSNFNILVEAQQIDPDRPDISFQETGSTLINVSIKIGSASTVQLSESDRDADTNKILIPNFNGNTAIPSGTQIILVFQNVRNPITHGETEDMILTIQNAAGQAVLWKNSGLTLNVSGTCELSPDETQIEILPDTKIVTEQSRVVITMTLGIPYDENQGKVVVDFPSTMQFDLRPVEPCIDLSLQSTKPIGCTVSGNSITFETYQQPNQNLVLGVFFVTNPHTAGQTDSFSLRSVDNVGTTSCSISNNDKLKITFVAASVDNTVLTRSPATLHAQNVQFSLSFTTTALLFTTDTLKIEIPDSDTVKLAGSSCKQGNTVKTCVWTGTTPAVAAVATNEIQSAVSEWCDTGNSQCASGSPFTVTLSNAANPKWLVAPDTTTVRISFEQGGGLIAQTPGTLRFTPVLELTSFTAITASRTAAQNVVGEATSYSFNFAVNTEIGAGGRIRIKFPDGACVPNTPSIAIAGVAQSLDSPTLYSSGNLESLVMTQACSSGCSTGQSFALTISGLLNPGSTKPITNSFVIQSYMINGAAQYFVDRSTITDVSNLALVPNLFQNFQNTPATTITGDIVTYTARATVKNSVPIGGQIEIIYPADIELSDNSVCSVTIPTFSSNDLACAVDRSARKVTVTTQKVITASEATFSIINVINPRSFRPTANIELTSYLVEGSSRYAIDQNVANSNLLTFAMDTQNDLAGVILRRIPVNSAEEVPIAGQPQTHYFAFEIYNPIPAGGQVRVTLNSEQLVISSVSAITVQEVSASGSPTGNSIQQSLSTSELVVAPCSALCASGTTIRFQILGATAPPTNVLPNVKIRIDTYTNLYSDTSLRYKIDFAEKDFVLPVSFGPLGNVVLNRVVPGSTTTDADQVGQLVDLITTWNPMHSARASGGVSAKFIFQFSDVFLYEPASGSLSCQSGPTGSLASATCEVIESTTDSDVAQKVLYNLRVSLPDIVVATEGTVDAQSYTVKVSGLQNPFNTNGAKSGTVTLFTAQPNAADTSRFESVNAKLFLPPTTDLPALSPGPLSVNSVTRSVSTVDAAVSLTFSLTTATKVVSGHSVIFILPRPFFEIVGDESSWTPTCDISCSGSVTSSAITLIVTNLVCQSSFPCSPGPASLTVSAGLKNAYNLAAQSDTFTIRTTTQLTSVLVDQFSASVAVTPQLTASATTVSTLSLDSRLTGEITNLNLAFTLASRVLSTDFLQIDLDVSSSNTAAPSLFTVPTGQTVSCSKVATASSTESALSSCEVTLSGVYISAVKVTGFCAPSGCSAGEAFSLILKNVELPGIAQDISTQITVLTATSDTAHIGTGTLTTLVDIEPNVFLNPSIAHVAEGACAGQIYQICTLRFTLTTKNPFPSNGFLQISIPTSNTELSFLTIGGAAACTNPLLAGDASNLSCTLSAGTVTLQHSFTDSSVTDDKTISLDVTLLTLPTSTRPTAAFTIRTMSPSFEIDKIDTLTFTAVPGALSSPVAARSAAKINVATEYKFSFLTTNPIDERHKGSLPDAAKVAVELPSEAEADFISTTGCTVSRNGSVQSSISMIIDIGTNKLTISNICTAAAFCPAGTLFNITCPSTTIRNKQWKKLDLDASTDSIKMGLRTPDGLYWFDALTSSLYATPELVPGDLTVVSLARGGDGNGQLVTLTTSVTPHYSSHIATGNLMFNINAGIFLDPDQAIEGKNSATGELKSGQIFKHYAGTSPLEVERVGINNPCGSGATCPLESNFGYSLEFLKNPILATTMPAAPMEIFTATSQGYMLDRGYSANLNTIFNDIAGAQFKSVQIIPEDPTVGTSTKYDLVAKLTSEVPSTAYLDLTWPSTLELTAPTCTDIFVAANTNLTCSLVTNTTGAQVLRITNVIAAGSSASGLVNGYFAVKVATLKNPSHTGAVGSLYASLAIPSGVLASGHFEVPAAKEALISCSEQCATCAGSPDYCVTCVKPGQLPFREGTGSTCVAECGSGFFLNPSDQKCYPCDDTCATCTGHRDSTCLSCTDPTPLKVDGSCVATCPANTFSTTLNSIQVCENDNSPAACTSPCVRCSSSPDYCLSCDTATTTADTLDPVRGTCVSSSDPSPHNCTSGWYPLTSGSVKQCHPCHYLCAECVERADSCLSCQPDLYLASTFSASNNTCSMVCPGGTYFGNVGCLSCNPICASCSGLLPSNCLSCNQSIPEISAPLYLLESQCVFECPYPYTEDTSARTCRNPGISLSKSVPIFIEIPLLVALVVFLLVSVCCVASKAERAGESGGGGFVWWNALFGLLAILEWVNRFLLLGNLFDKKYPLLFAFHFMVLFSCSFLGLYFHLMYLSPMLYLSLYFSKLYSRFRKSFRTVIVFAYIAGSNVFRLISSKLFRAPGLSNNFGSFTFWVRPLELVGWFALALSGIEFLICISVMAVVPQHTDAFMCAILGLFWNTGLIILQVFTWLYMRKNYPLSMMDQEEAKLIDPQNPSFALNQQ